MCDVVLQIANVDLKLVEFWGSWYLVFLLTCGLRELKTDGMGWDMLWVVPGTGVATALKVVQRHSPFLAKPEGKAG